MGYVKAGGTGWSERASSSAGSNSPMSSERREITGSTTKHGDALLAAKAAGDFLLHVHHLKIFLRLIVIKGTAKSKRNRRTACLRTEKQCSRLRCHPEFCVIGTLDRPSSVGLHRKGHGTYCLCTPVTLNLTTSDTNSDIPQRNSFACREKFGSSKERTKSLKNAQ